MSGNLKETDWSDKHYDCKYELKDKDIKRGFIKIDPYLVDKVWRTSVLGGMPLGHILKTLARWGQKNTIERETKAVAAQIFGYAELHDIDLTDICEKYLKNNVQN